MSNATNPPRDPAWLARAGAKLAEHCMADSDTGCRCRKEGSLAMLGVFCAHDLATLLAAVDTAAEARGREAGDALRDSFLRSRGGLDVCEVCHAWRAWGDGVGIIEHRKGCAVDAYNRTRPTAPAPFPVSGEVRLSDLSQAFIDGAREARRNPSATDAQIVRASDGYVKLILKRQQDATAPARRDSE